MLPLCGRACVSRPDCHGLLRLLRSHAVVEGAKDTSFKIRASIMNVAGVKLPNFERIPEGPHKGLSAPFVCLLSCQRLTVPCACREHVGSVSRW